ncbi:MAG: 3D domain-containing protein, partial [Caldilineaceae bacterium]|nr:3D domain-containing protein [Caldilineaceae bacterium]
TAGVSPDAANYGRTYTGETMRHGIVAVDPQVIPLRTQVFVPDYGVGDALDMGSAIRARRIDLGFDDTNLQLWNRWVDVYLLWPPPPEYQITWVLPNWPLPPR